MGLPGSSLITRLRLVGGVGHSTWLFHSSTGNKVTKAVREEKGVDNWEEEGQEAANRLDIAESKIQWDVKMHL